VWRCHRLLQTAADLQNSKIPNTNMDACTGVEKEVDKVLSKFGGINDHADRTLGDLCTHIESLKNSIEEGRRKNQIGTEFTSDVSLIKRIYFLNCPPFSSLSASQFITTLKYTLLQHPRTKS
jgi:hypothetical protein